MPPTTSPLAEMLPRDEAAAYIGVQPSTLAYWRHVGRYRDELPCARIGAKCFYRIADLDRWLAARFSDAADVR